jgi:hypothetical protein
MDDYRSRITKHPLPYRVPGVSVSSALIAGVVALIFVAALWFGSSL